jgi:cysteinyl-tRNA synthetase
MRAREGYLLDEVVQTTPAITPELVETAKKAFAAFLPKVEKALPSPVAAASDALATFTAIAARDSSDTEFARGAREKEEKFPLYLTSLATARDAILGAEKKSGLTVKQFVDQTAYVLGPYLGETRGDTIEDPRVVSRNLAAHWEGQFFKDMERLHVLPPDTITRVSEYVPEIVKFVEKIISNGFAYEAEGSVWFDVAKFEGSTGDGFRHEYAKLQPNSKGNKKLIDEGEGALTGTKGKRQAADFALWKARSKPGEPSWPSPWGEGRPGWHIECSVMASDILGDGMDIHSGGVDLMFPHHDNELAQSEAYHGCKQWVNYFLHTGHLHIEGLKMSKSLKNFISIDDALGDYTPRQLRLAFMLQSWNAKMDFRRDLVVDVKAKEETFDKFFTNVKARISETAAKPLNLDGTHGYDELEKALEGDLHKAQQDFRIALSDSFNTSQAINVLLDLISKVNLYFSARGPNYNIGPVRVIAQWITRQLKMFGLGEGAAIADATAVGWGKEGDSGSSGDVS